MPQAEQNEIGALDNQTRSLMQELLLGIREAERTTIPFVTHDIEEAIFMAGRVTVMIAQPERRPKPADAGRARTMRARANAT